MRREPSPPRDNRPTVVVAGLHLRIENGVEAGHVIAIRDLPCKLGRGGQSDVMLADPDDPPAVSRDHARISRQGGRLIFTDHSINGSRVGTRWLSCGESEVLRPGDEIQLGPTLLLTVLREGAPAPPRQLARPVAPASVRPGRLREALTSYETLEAAWHRVELNRGAAGPDNVTVADFARTAPARLKELRDQLLRGRYEPLPPRLFAAPKRRGGVRTISILAVRDRVVQQALHNVLQPLLEPTFLPCSFAYRPALCAHHALRAVDALLAQGKVWIAETDIASFFDNVVHAILLEKLREQAPDPYILTLVARCLAAGACAPGLGIPQGAATSPLFANLYLTCFDQHMTDQNCAMVRYGDDLVIPCTSRAEAQAALAEAEGYLRSQLQLSLKAENTRVVYLAQGFIFLGFEFRASGRRPAPQALSQLQQRLADASPGESQRVVRGWRQYYGPTDRPTPEAAAQKQWQPSSDMRIARRMLSLFVGRQDVYARQGTSRQGKPRFVPCQGSLSEARLAAHLAGTETLAIYLHRLDGSVRLLVLDIDVVPEEKGELDLAVCAREALRVCRQADLPACLEDSGGGGCHLWVFFAEPVSPELARRLGRLLAIAARLMRPGIRVEVFPRQAEWAGADLGDAAKLPLGVHPVTGRRCLLLDDNGEPIADPAVALERVRPIPLAQVQAAIALLSPPDDASVHERRRRVSAQVRKLLSACPVIAHLRRVAAQTGRLRHTHRLILLYTAGRLGEKGARFVHETLAHCQNYSPEITQRHLDRLDPNHQPITCRRIREWLEEEGEQAVCACEPMPQTPLDALAPAAESASPRRRRGRRPPSAPRSPERSDAAQRWAEVAADLFSEEPERPEGLQTEP